MQTAGCALNLLFLANFVHDDTKTKETLLGSNAFFSESTFLSFAKKTYIGITFF